MTCTHGLDRDQVGCLQCENEKQARRFRQAIPVDAEELARLRESRDGLLAAAYGVDAVYAEYMQLRPDPNTRAFECVTEAVRKARAAIARATPAARKCPFPICGDDGSVSQCITNGHCGCDESTDKATS